MPQAESRGGQGGEQKHWGLRGEVLLLQGNDNTGLGVEGSEIGTCRQPEFTSFRAGQIYILLLVMEHQAGRQAPFVLTIPLESKENKNLCCLCKESGLLEV